MGDTTLYSYIYSYFFIYTLFWLKSLFDQRCDYNEFQFKKYIFLTLSLFDTICDLLVLVHVSWKRNNSDIINSVCIILW
jgi:hypothetical protein